MRAVDQKNAEAAVEDAKETVRKMLATGETRKGIAELLDVSVSYVRTIDVAASKKSKPGSDSGDIGAAGSEESRRVGVVAGHEGSDH